jgi:phosphate transport system substrate-binding protein
MGLNPIAAIWKLILALGLVIACPLSAREITGAGATFPAPIYFKWAYAWRNATGNALNYQSIGSGGGQSQIIARTVDFGASDDPMTSANLRKHGLVQFPTVIGALVPIVNLRGVSNGQLRLTAPVLAGIYQGRITRWNDPAIARLNPGLQIKALPITPVYRSDSSGTTAVFSKYMAKAAPGVWTLGAGKSISWPRGSGGKGNEGVAANVKNTPGSIGYVEANFAIANKLTMVQMPGASGRFVVPSPKSFDAAAAQADWSQAKDGVIDLMLLPGEATWPIVSATYALVEAKPRNPKRTADVLAFFTWAWANGGKAAIDLGFTPLPPAGIAKAREEWSAISGVKAPL